MKVKMKKLTIKVNIDFQLQIKEKPNAPIIYTDEKESSKKLYLTLLKSQIFDSDSNCKEYSAR